MQIGSVLLLALAFPCPAAAQTWSRTFDVAEDDFAVDVKELPNGNIAVLRRERSWAQHLTVLDSSGNALWEERPSNWSNRAGLACASDGSIALAGQSYPEAALIVYDGAGTVLHSRRGSVHFGVEETGHNAVRPTADGGWITAGWNTQDECDLDLFVRRYDSAGLLVWDRIYGHDNFLVDVPGMDVLELADGTFRVTGRYSSQIHLMALASDGSLMWKNVFLSQIASRAPQFDLTPGGTLMIVPGRCFPSRFSLDDDFLVIAVATDGTVQWQRRYDGGAADESADVVATSDGGCLVVGSTKSFGSSKDIRLMRLDANGDVVWHHTYGGPAADIACGVCTTADGGFLVAGATRNPTNGEWDGLLLRLDSAGLIAGCVPGPAWTTPEDVSLGEQDPLADPLVLVDVQVDNPVSLTETPTSTSAECLSLPVGSRYCTPGVPNSTGGPASIWALGSTVLAHTSLALAATDMPAGKFGYFVTGMGTATTTPPGSQGVLCLNGSTIYRYAQQAFSSGNAGAFALVIDVNAIPGHGAIQPGETWNFQAWHRDNNPGATSNFTDAVGVMFF